MKQSLKSTAGTIRPCIAVDIIADARAARPDLYRLSDKAFIERAISFFSENSTARNIQPITIQPTQDTSNDDTSNSPSLPTGITFSDDFINDPDLE